jgi:hypothetical protein
MGHIGCLAPYCKHEILIFQGDTDCIKCSQRAPVRYENLQTIRAIIKPSNPQTFLSAATLERKTFRLCLSMRLEN